MSGSPFATYLELLKHNFVKRSKLEFLNEDGAVAFSLDNSTKNNRDKTFLQDGSLTVNLQNGSRRTASVTLANINNEYDYNVNKLWFGTQVRLLMGLMLPDGTDYMIPQGVFEIKDPVEEFNPSQKTMTLNLVDKWANLDGTLSGQLEGTYECPVNSNIFDAINAILLLDKGNGHPIDGTPAIYTNYYNDKTQLLPDGTVASLIRSPYTARFDSEGQTYADIILELNDMIAGVIGYDMNGALRIDPSQDDILDINKPVMWTFSPEESQMLGASYTVLNSEVKNDIIKVGQALNDGYELVGGRAQNFDPSSDTNINLIGLRTERESKAGYYTDRVCMDLAEFELKRKTILNKSVSIKSTQMFHLVENNLVVIRRTDKKGAPYERHLVNGFTIPIGYGEMTIQATSVNDFPIATVTELHYE